MELAHPGLKQPEPPRVKGQVGRAAGLAAADQPRVLQNLDVLVDRRERQASHPGELADGAGLQAEDVHDLAPVWNRFLSTGAGTPNPAEKRSTRYSPRGRSH